MIKKHTYIKQTEEMIKKSDSVCEGIWVIEGQLGEFGLNNCREGTRWHWVVYLVQRHDDTVQRELGTAGLTMYSAVNIVFAC